MSMLLTVHAGGAAIGLVAGAAALAFKKGAKWHRSAGRVFLISMLVMAVSAMPLAYMANKTMDILSGMLVCYLVLTSWWTLRQKHIRMEIGLLVLGGFTLAGYLWVEWEAARTGIRRPDVPAGAGYVFATILALALIGDGWRMLQRDAARNRQIIRHLWRMCFALFIATVSFFLSRAHLFPGGVRESGVLYLFALAPVLMMAFWWGRTRFAGPPSRADTLGFAEPHR